MNLIKRILGLMLAIGVVYAGQSQETHRFKQFSNQRVNVWRTVIYPSTQHQLKMHRHDHDRVLVALTDGTLKVTNDKGKSHWLKLEKNTAYYLSKDPKNELHRDENFSNHPIQVMIVELN